MAAFERSEAAPKKAMAQLARQIEQIKQQVTNPYAFTKALGETLVIQTQLRFLETKQSPAKKSWAPWSAKYAKTRKGGDSLLIDNSSHKGSDEHLWQSFKPTIEANAVTVSTDKKYAMPLHRGTSKMPARPFIGMSRDDLAELEQVLQDVLEAMIEKKPAKKRGKR